MLRKVSVKDYQRTLRMQLIQLESQRAQALEKSKELERRIGLIDEVLSWDLITDGANVSPSKDQIW